MSVADWVTLGLLALCIGGVLLFLRRQKKRGGGCAGCSGCAGCREGGCPAKQPGKPPAQP